MNNWKQMPLGYCVTEVNKKNILGNERNLLSLSYGRVIRKDIEGNGGLLPESFDTYNIIEAGDTVLRLTDLQNDQRSLRVGFAEERGIITSAYVTIRPNRHIYPAYLSYFLKQMDACKGFYALGAGVRQSLKYDELRRIDLTIPPLSQQRAMADFLDRETTRIDALIDKKRRMVDLLIERRHALITAAVTGELDLSRLAE